MNQIPGIDEFAFLRPFRLSRRAIPRDGFGNRLAKGWGTASEVQGIRPWDETSTRMAAVASGRLGYPVALETPRENLADLFLLIDCRSSLSFGSTTQTILERIITLGLVLARVALEDGWRIHPLIFSESGLSAVPSCSKPRDWFALHDMFGNAETFFPPGENGNRFPRQRLASPGFCIYSEADPDHGPQTDFLPQVRNLMGRMRVFDPWEKFPPIQKKISLIGPCQEGRENWSSSRNRTRIREYWDERNQRWENDKPGRFPALTHSTDQKWETAMGEWFEEGKGGKS